MTAPNPLSEVSTKDLIAELSQRDNVTRYVIREDEEYRITRTKPEPGILEAYEGPVVIITATALKIQELI